MSTITPPHQAGTNRQVQTLPDSMTITAATIRSWRHAGYQVTEQRKAEWLYLIVRGAHESAIYKVVGPIFNGPVASYAGFRVAERERCRETRATSCDQ
jgi:hypothetical protein